MKKLFLLMLVAVMAFTLVACKTEVEEFVDDHSKDLCEMMESTMGGAAKVSVKADDDDMIFDVRLTGIDGYTAEQKQQIQSTYDSMGSVWQNSLSMMRKDLPELDTLIINVRESDGDLLATVKAR